MNPSLAMYLAPTAIIDSDHPAVREAAAKALAGVPAEEACRAAALYRAVRDPIRYNPYLPFYRPEHYRASGVLAKGQAFCVGKAGLLCALARAAGIPARLGFADVRNHLATRQLVEFMGSDLFVYHGYTELYVRSRWVKATPAFNRELCQRHRVAPLEFDGLSDSIFHPYNAERRLFMEYVTDHGSFADVPVERIVAAWEAAYGRDRVRSWIAAFEASGGGAPPREFEKEDVVAIGDR